MTLEAAANSAPPAGRDAGHRPARALLRAALQLLVSLGLVAYSLSLVDVRAVRLDAIAWGWLVAGVAITFPAMLACALRWRFTARRLALPITLRMALREYYVSTFVNQVVPSGMAGEALRVVRHGAQLGADRAAFGSSFRAVLLERLAGQGVLWGVVLLGAPLWLEPHVPDNAAPYLLGLGGALLLGYVFVKPRLSPWLARHLDEAHHAVLHRDALPVQLATSLATVLCCLGLFACCALALHAPLDALSFLRIAPLVLASMTLPISLAGWGVRELATSSLYAASGLDPAVGTATSVLYGLVMLVASLPGAFGALRWRAEE